MRAEQTRLGTVLVVSDGDGGCVAEWRWHNGVAEWRWRAAGNVLVEALDGSGDRTELSRAAGLTPRR